MSSGQFLDALASERRHNERLIRIVFAVVALGVVSTWLAWRQPKSIDVHLAPDVRAGDTVRVSNGRAPVPPPNVYGFAYYIWQQVNRWQTDGSKDYGQQIFSMQYYLTPRCQAQLQADMELRQGKGELRRRTRQITEIPGFPYSENRVLSEGADAWTVLLDMQVTETFGGVSVKDVFIRYPLRVVRFDVDRERNPWHLAVDCFGANRPARLNPADLKTGAEVRADLTAPRLPGTISPASLPRDTAVD
ncbi:PFL_4703 family integrating conjugative element protein [Xylophilus sp. ASV27]|uniref:PFL_4703 family integrating conjugative element protein n=1 Tax=Xylophilus sp. ASV27 TaxID=2795129 RepID=UPI0018EE0652|nr:TIGR03746 family integrating conjugative element protein [Xylophilus sp. ASV27]